MKHLSIIFSLILLTSPLYGQSETSDKEYRYKITSGLLWKTIGKGKIQPKDKGYVGSYKNGVPYGKGTMNYYDGKKLVGQFKRYAWNSTLYDKNGNVLGKFVKGKYIKK